MHPNVTSRLARALAQTVPAALLAGGLFACAAAPMEVESTCSAASADSSPGCKVETSCAGILGAPPELTVTCPYKAAFYTISPSGTETGLGVATSYSTSMEDYAVSLEVCGVLQVGPFEFPSSTCQSFSLNSPPSAWCPAAPTTGSGGAGPAGGSGHGACRGTCS